MQKPADKPYYYTKANQYWMIFSEVKYPGTEKKIEKKNGKFPKIDFK
mgnify:CR=1 FL=1